MTSQQRVGRRAGREGNTLILAGMSLLMSLIILLTFSRISNLFLR